jgi:hypothetical protein
VANAADGGQAGAPGVSDLLVGKFVAVGIGQQEDAGMGELARRGLAGGDQLFEGRALLGVRVTLYLVMVGTPSPEGLTVASTVQRASSTPLINRRRTTY